MLAATSRMKVNSPRISNEGDYGGGEGDKGGPVAGYEAEGDQGAGHGRQVERRPAGHLGIGLPSCTLKHEMLGYESGHERLLPVVVHCSSVHPSGRGYAAKLFDAASPVQRNGMRPGTSRSA